MRDLDSLSELRDQLLSHAHGRRTNTLIPRVSLSRSQATTGPLTGLYEPMLCLVIQGAKSIIIGDRILNYDPGHYFATAIEVPATGSIVVASGDRPYLAVSLAFEPSLVAEFGACCDSIWLDLSKGLGCPMGAVLAGSEEFIDAAKQWKFRLGGAMRQAGVVAAAGLYALNHHVERLRTDHENARRFANALRSIDAVSVLDPETNLIFFDIRRSNVSAPEVAAALANTGIGVGVESGTTLRAVTHLGVNANEIDETVAAIAQILK
ncbi:beta-eliminating lyase-related protein [Burkholderia cenocepacia]